jgi:hypothetical protein
MEQGHEWVPVVAAADCTRCECCGEALCPRCQDHYADCPCPGPHQNDLFYYRSVGGRLLAIPRDTELLPDEGREPTADLGQEPDDQAEPADDREDDDGYAESVFDRMEWADFVAGDSLDGPIGGEG